MIVVEIVCLAECRSIEFIDELLLKVMKQAEFAEYKQLHFAAHEAVINSIEATKKCYGEDHTKNIKIKIMAQKQRAEVLICDKAGGLPKEVAESMKSIDFEDKRWNERGRGILFIKHFVDECLYYLDENEDAVCKLIKEVKK